MKVIFLKFIILLLLLSNTYASLIFHSGGIFQSNTFVPDLVFIIFNFGNSFLIIFKVFPIPLPAILLQIENNLYLPKL